MASPHETQTMQSWSASNEELDWDDDILEGGLFTDEEEFDSVGFYFHDSGSNGYLTARQRIEIARENRMLLSSISDLDLNNNFEYPEDQPSAEYSY